MEGKSERDRYREAIKEKREKRENLKGEKIKRERWGRSIASLRLFYRYVTGSRVFISRLIGF